MRRARNGQSTLEIAVLICVVIAAVLAMQIFMKRAVQGRLRASSDSIGTQWDPLNATYTTVSTSDGARHDELSQSGYSKSEFSGAGEVSERKSTADETVAAATSDKLF